MKRIIVALFMLVALGIVLSGCVPDDSSRGSVVDEITVVPRKVKKSETGKIDEFLTITVKLKDSIDTSQIDIEQSYLFIKGPDDSVLKGVQDPATPVQVDKEKHELVFKIAYTWLQNLSVGEHTVGVALTLPNGSVKEDRKDTGFVTIEK